MKNLRSLLEKFSKTLDKDNQIKESVVRVIKEKTKASIEGKNVSIRNGVLELNLNPVEKNEIILKEGEIKEELKRNGVFFSRVLYK